MCPRSTPSLTWVCPATTAPVRLPRASLATSATTATRVRPTIGASQGPAPVGSPSASARATPSAPHCRMPISATAPSFATRPPCHGAAMSTRRRSLRATPPATMRAARPPATRSPAPAKRPSRYPAQAAWTTIPAPSIACARTARASGCRRPGASATRPRTARRSATATHATAACTAKSPYFPRHASCWAHLLCIARPTRTARARRTLVSPRPANAPSRHCPTARFATTAARVPTKAPAPTAAARSPRPSVRAQRTPTASTSRTRISATARCTAR